MTDAEKIERIKKRVNDLIKVNLRQCEDIRISNGTKCAAYALHFGGCEDLKMILNEIESGEIFD